jgi:uncharacterized membrane protein YfcA
MTTFAVITAGLALLAGLGIGLALGTLGAGGSILAVPVLVYLLGQSAAQATTGSLVVVGTTSAVSAYAAWRAGKVLPGRGAVFGLVATGGAAAGAVASSHVPDAVLLASFAAIVAVVAAVMIVRQVEHARRATAGTTGRALHKAARPRFDDPIITFSPTFMCRCPRAVKVLVAATLVGLLTGFLGVGGGFLVVPALVLALALPMHYAAGTSLVVITITAGTALAVRAGTGTAPDWTLVALLTVAAVAGGWLGTHLASRISTDRLQAAFTALLVAVGAYSAWQAIPALI